MNAVESVNANHSGTALTDRVQDWVSALHASLATKATAALAAKTTSAVSAKLNPAALATNKGVPMGLLMSVAQPAVADTNTHLDYEALRTALLTNNLTAAQEAYSRLQSDLLMFQGAQTATTSNHPSGSQLNTAA